MCIVGEEFIFRLFFVVWVGNVCMGEMCVFIKLFVFLFCLGVCCVGICLCSVSVWRYVYVFPCVRPV